MFVWKMFRTSTLSTEPLASLKKMPNNPGPRDVLQLGAGSGKGNPASGPVILRFTMFIDVAPAALVTTAPV